MPARAVVTGFLSYLLLITAACIAGDSQSEKKKVVLQYWTPPWDLRTMAEIFENYERDHPNVKVVLGQSAARNMVDDPQRVLCSIVGGDPPDVIVFDRYAVAEWAARGAFMDLNPFLEGDKARSDGVKAENFYKPCWEEAHFEGKLYGVPIQCDNRALYYNKDILIKNGLVDEKGEARPPKSWDELRAYAKRLSRFEDGPGKALQVAGFVPNFGNSWLYIYGWQNHAKFMSDDGKTCLLNEPAVVEALTFMKNIYDDMGGAPEVISFQSSFQTGELDPFITGKVAMKIDGNWVLPAIAANRPELNFGVAPAPMKNPNDPPISWLGGFAWVIPRGAKNPDEAWALIRSLASVETAMHIAEIQRRTEASQGRPYIPLLNSNRVITETLFKKYMKDDPEADPKFVQALQVFIDLLPASKYRPVTPVGMLLWNRHRSATEDAIFAKEGSVMTPQRALDQGAAVVQRALDRIELDKRRQFGPEAEREAIVSWSLIAAIYFVLLVAGGLYVLFWFTMRFKGGRQARAEARAGWLFASPWIVGFIVFTGGPILCSLVMSFCSYDAMSPSRWVGLRNYRDMLSDDVFLKSLGNTAYMLVRIPMSMAFGLGVAMLLNAQVKGMAVYRTLFYLPAIVPGVASALLWILIFNPKSGILNWALNCIGIDGPNWLHDQNWSKPALILQGLWGAGAGMIVWLAGLKAIPGDLYEAAAIDGATAIQRFRHITLPMLTPYIFFSMVMGFIDTLKLFEPAYLITLGGPVDSTLFYAYSLFNHAFRYMHMGYASALSWILFAIVFAVTMFQNKMSSRWVHYQGE